MERLDRLERVTDLLLVLLDTPRPLSLREIADRVPGYPDRQAARRQAFERDKRLLRDEGVPVLVVPVGGEDQLGYRVDPVAYYLPDLGLEAEEQAALNLAVAGVHLGEPIGQQALLKLGAGGESPRPRRPDPAGGPPVLRGSTGPPLPVRGRSAGCGGRVRVPGPPAAGRRGRSPFPQRPLVPGRIRSGPAGGPHLPGRSHRGHPPPRSPGSARIPDDFDVEEAFSLDPWRFGDGEEIEVEIRVDAAEAGRVVAELGPESVVDRTAEGAVVVRLSVTDVGALVLWVLDLLDHAEVVGPDRVRAAVIERLQASVAAVPPPGPGIDGGVRASGRTSR